MHLFNKIDNGIGYRTAILWEDSSISLLHQTGNSLFILQLSDSLEIVMLI